MITDLGKELNEVIQKNKIKSAVGYQSNSAFVWALSASCLLVLHLQIRGASELHEG
jgi:hypothetical protein